MILFKLDIFIRFVFTRETMGFRFNTVIKHHLTYKKIDVFSFKMHSVDFSQCIFFNCLPSRYLTKAYISKISVKEFLWVKYKSFRTTQISIKDCANIDDLISLAVVKVHT